MGTTESCDVKVQYERNLILVSSLYPLGGNYGGILQAYALQRILKQLGFRALTIDSNRRFAKIRGALHWGRYCLRRMAFQSQALRPSTKGELAYREKFTRDFVSSNISTVDLFGLSGPSRESLLSEVAAIVVGSDQVWRGGYASLPDQFLKYAYGLPVRKISYSASFGSDRLIRFSSRMVKQSRELISEFNAISVREDSAVEICADVWGKTADQHVDPTLLLDAHEYIQLARTAGFSVADSGGGVFAYILDESPQVDRVLSDISARLNLTVNRLTLGRTSSIKSESTVAPEQLAPVEEWLENFAGADFIVTDSFHGTVFAIIFRKPFLVVGNRDRGLARFESILRLFGLEDRLVVEGVVPPSVFDFSPNWSVVSEIIKHEQSRALEYLKINLGPI